MYIKQITYSLKLIFLVIFCQYESDISACITAKRYIAYSEFQKIPKAELHLHLGGAYPIDFLLEIASPKQREKLMENLDLISNGVSYQNAFQVFNLISQIVNTDEKVELGTYALCCTLETDGVFYAEVRTGLKDLGNGLESYLQSVLKGLKRGRSDCFEGRLILSLQRNSTIENAKKTIDLALKYQDQGVVGIDISGDSTIGNIETIFPELLRAKESGLFLTVHMGESPHEKDQQQILEVLHPDRIGHGVHLTAESLKWIFENKIPIEVCLTSSILVQMTNANTLHPALSYYLQGHPIVICTDDPLIFRTTLSNELKLLYELSNLKIDQIKEIANASFKYTFLR